MSTEIDSLAKTIWNYHLLNQPLQKADCILALGSNDLRVAERAAQLFLDGFAPTLIFSGGVGRLTAGMWGKSEAETFAEVAVKMGVPSSAILVEPKSTNTGENVQFTKKLLAEKGIDPKSFILVQKPYMERRTYATFKKVWPEKNFTVTSPQIPFEKYPNETLSKDLIINIMVGDLQRIKEYPARGFQIPQEIPAEVWSAFEKLVAAGYTHHLIKD